ncbi:hypothetical protein CB1_000449033 [Camelus ferus]|nr:hypothetical protein CB1_000449033 [Camelus ferus]
MVQAVLLLCCVFLSPVAAFPRNGQKGALNFQPSFTETGHALNRLSNQIPLPDPKTCQDLLGMASSLAPLPEYLSSLALEVVLEEVGCPTEAHLLQLQLVKMGGKDTTETLIRESKKHNEEEGTGITTVVLRDQGGPPGELRRVQRSVTLPELQLVKMGGKDTTETLIRESKKHNEEEGTGITTVVLRDQGGPPGELRRVQRSVTLPEACRLEHRWVLYETAKLIAEFADKLSSTELVTELKASAINVTQKCTDESWKHLEAVGKRLMKSPEAKGLTMPIEDQIYFAKRTITLLLHIILEHIQEASTGFIG